MDWLDWLAGERTAIAPAEAILRLFVASVVGGLVGLDREIRDKPAGLRTHMLVSLAAAIFTIIALELYFEVISMNEDANADPIRIIEAVTAGVAFLAAGAIIRGQASVQGITTGANMWFAGALGVACGGGYYMLAVVGTFFALVVLIGFGALESRLERLKTKRNEPERES